MYHYAGNNPIRYTDPDGRSVLGNLCYVGAFFVLAAGTTVSVLSGGTLAVFVEPVAIKASVALGATGFVLNTAEVINDVVNNNQSNSLSFSSSSSTAAAASPSPLPPDPNDNKEKKSTKSTNQMQQDVNKGKAPKSVERVDKGNTAMKGEQDHVHFKDGNALNRNGTWKEGAGRTLTRSEQQWLQSGGFTLPE